MGQSILGGLATPGESLGSLVPERRKSPGEQDDGEDGKRDGGEDAHESARKKSRAVPRADA